MRRMLKAVGLFAVLAILNLATVAVFLSAIPAQAGLQEPAPPCNRADTNGDGSEGLADAIKLLNYLFSEGDPPVACAEGEKADVQAEMTAALAKFMPRAGELYFERIAVDPKSAEILVEVPEGRAFILLSATQPGVLTVFRNKERLDDIFEPDDSQVSRTLPELRVPFLPGDTLEIENTDDTSRQTWVHGYFLDYEEPEE